MPWCGRWVLSWAVPTPVLSTEPASPGSPSNWRGVLLKSTGIPCHLGFSWALADKERRLCIPAGSRETMLSLASASRCWSFHVAPQRRYQPLCTPASAMVSPPHPGFEERHTAFCSNGYFLFACWQHLISFLAFLYFFPSFICPVYASSCYSLCF